MRVVFMGTPEFAVPCLRALADGGHEVTAVYTQPDKPQGRRMRLTPPPVKEEALKYGIPVFQPKSLKGQNEAARISSLKPDAVIVAAYGKILPENILSIPKYGCVNIHASLLPKYRGAAPVQAAIMNGDTETGITSMLMAPSCDTGDILLQEPIPIGQDETTPELTKRLAETGAEVLLNTLEGLKNGTIRPKKQDEAKMTYVSIIKKSMSPVDWSCPAAEIHNKVRGLYPWPAASTQLNGHRLKIYRSRLTGEKEFGEPGLVIPQKDGFFVCCGDGTSLELLEVQTEGGKRMSGSDYKHGHPVQGLKLG
jgi:methionyl-tRNA formyltransferase